jgi:DNA-binding response OmpR family regulator
MTAGAKVLLVEDEPSLARGLVDNLHAEGFEVRHVARGDLALAAIRQERPDVVILDLLLPGRNGLEILRELRASGDDVPVLVLTARGEVVDRVVGLETGADDYLGKPFAIRELMARVKALVRRRVRPGMPPKGLVLGAIRFDFEAMSAVGPDGRLELTLHDLLVLQVLADRRGEVVSREDIVEEVCGLNSSATLRTVDNHVVALRRVVEDDPRHPRWLITVRGLGYRLTRDDNG